MEGILTGGCLCGAVRYSLRDGFRSRPYACHCTDCQKRTGSAFSEHMLFALQDFTAEGDLDFGLYKQPSGSRSTIWGCARCKARIYATSDRRPDLGSLRCGTLDNAVALFPAAHVWTRSKQPWIALPDGIPAVPEQPQTQDEWLALVGPR